MVVFFPFLLNNKLGLRQGAKGFAFSMVLFSRFFFCWLAQRVLAYSFTLLKYLLNISSEMWNRVNVSENFTTFSANPYSSHFIWLMFQFWACCTDSHKFKWVKIASLYSSLTLSLSLPSYTSSICTLQLVTIFSLSNGSHAIPKCIAVLLCFCNKIK